MSAAVCRCRTCGQQFDINNNPIGVPLGASCAPPHLGPFDAIEGATAAAAPAGAVNAGEPVRSDSTDSKTSELIRKIDRLLLIAEACTRVASEASGEWANRYFGINEFPVPIVDNDETALFDEFVASMTSSLEHLLQTIEEAVDNKECHVQAAFENFILNLINTRPLANISTNCKTRNIFTTIPEFDDDGFSKTCRVSGIPDLTLQHLGMPVATIELKNRDILEESNKVLAGIAQLSVYSKADVEFFFKKRIPVPRFLNILTNGRTWSLLKAQPFWTDGALTGIDFSYTVPLTVMWSATMNSVDKRRVLTLVYAMWKQALENAALMAECQENDNENSKDVSQFHMGRGGNHGRRSGSGGGRGRDNSNHRRGSGRGGRGRSGSINPHHNAKLAHTNARMSLTPLPLSMLNIRANAKQFDTLADVLMDKLSNVREVVHVTAEELFEDF